MTGEPIVISPPEVEFVYGPLGDALVVPPELGCDFWFVALRRPGADEPLGFRAPMSRTAALHIAKIGVEAGAFPVFESRILRMIFGQWAQDVEDEAQDG